MQLRKALQVAIPTFIIGLLITLCFGASPVTADTGDETTYYLLTDHLGSVDVVLDEQGEVVERRDYLPYGSARAEVSTSEAPETDHKFTGKELDDETGLHYYSARYYDAEIGRFVSIDPVSLNEGFASGVHLNDILDKPQLLNSYSYAANNPINLNDPTGEIPNKVAVTIVVTAAATTYQYAERAGNGLGFLYETYVTGDYDQAMNYARAYDENSKDFGEAIYLSAKKIANDLIPLSGTVLGKLVEEDIFVESFSLEDAVLNAQDNEANVNNAIPSNHESGQDDENNNHTSEDLGYNGNVGSEGDEDE